MVFPRFIHVVQHVPVLLSSLLPHNIPWCGCTTFIYPLTSWWTSGLFPLSTIMNDAAMHIHILTFGWTYIFISLDYIHRMALLGHTVTPCLSFGGLPDCFQCRRIILHSHQQHPCLYLSSSVFFITAILACVKWYHMVVLTRIWLMANDAEQLFLCLLIICIFSLGKYLFRSLALKEKKWVMYLFHCITSMATQKF